MLTFVEKKGFTKKERFTNHSIYAKTCGQQFTNSFKYMNKTSKETELN